MCFFRTGKDFAGIFDKEARRVARSSEFFSYTINSTEVSIIIEEKSFGDLPQLMDISPDTFRALQVRGDCGIGSWIFLPYYPLPELNVRHRQSRKSN